MKAIEYAHKNRERFLDELKDLLRIPSVSTQESHKPDMVTAANWLRERLLAAGTTRAEVMPTAGHPVVYAEWLEAGPERPTVLIYGHYDVQPPDPLDLWRDPPFEPTVVGDDLFARGATDDKGQLFIHVKAIESFMQTAGKLPVNVKCIFEGEEEIGSVNLDPFIRQNRKLLAADVVAISDGHMLTPQQPAITYGLRGLSYNQVEVTGPSRDLHSGSFGGAVHNPIHALADMVSSLHDKNGRITIPGFYDRVRPLLGEEKAELARTPFDRDQWLQEAGVSTDWGEPEYTIVERTTARPTLDVNGIWGGYIEPGAKTVLPARAFAKISMRLVPDQDPDEIAELFKQYLESIAPPTVQIKVTKMSSAFPAISQRDSSMMRAAIRAYAEVIGAGPIFLREGGSIPVVASFQKELNAESLLMGFGLPDDNTHSPNEKFHLPNFYRGIDTIIRFLEILAE